MFYTYDPLFLVATGNSSEKTAYSTAAPWPSVPMEAFQVLRYVEEADAWEVIYDYRGSVIINTATGDNRTVTDLGPLPDGWRLADGRAVDPGSLQYELEMALEQRLNGFAKDRGWKSGCGSWNTTNTKSSARPWGSPPRPISC